MVLPWRRRKTSHSRNKKELSLQTSNKEINIPPHFRCPISLDLMRDPVTLSTGITYDRESIEKWIESGNQTCPVTKKTLKPSDQPVPNHSIRKMIQDWCVRHRSFGIERIPTPRIPITPHDVSEIQAKIEDATWRADHTKCLELVGKIEDLAKESERNKKCLAQNGLLLVLSTCFEKFASVSIEEHVNLLELLLSALTWMLPPGLEGYSKLGSKASLRCMVWILNNGDSNHQQNAAFCLKELLWLDQRHAHALVDIEGAVEGFVKLVRNPICPNSTKSSLMAVFYMISLSEFNEKIISRFIETGLVSLIAEIIIDAEKSICEKSLCVLDAICESKVGREEAYKNALIAPLLVKKILRVSDWATRSAISILWKLYKSDKAKGEEVLIDAYQVGAFQKLLVVLQVGCEESTKEKVSDLLKMMNLHRAKLEASCCVDTSLDMKHVKRPF